MDAVLKDSLLQAGSASLDAAMKNKAAIAALQSLVRSGLGNGRCLNLILTFDGDVYEVSRWTGSGRKDRLIARSGKTLMQAVAKFIAATNMTNDDSDNTREIR